MAVRARKQAKAHKERICAYDFKLTHAFEAAAPGAAGLAPLVRGGGFCRGWGGGARGEALNGPEDDARLFGSLGEDVVAVEQETVYIVAMYHGGAEVRVVQGDGVVGAGGLVGEVGEHPEVHDMVHAATQEVAAGGVECD